MWQGLYDVVCGVDEIDVVIVMFFDFGCYGEDVGIEDDVLWWKVYVVDQNVIGVVVDFDFVVFGVGLFYFVKGYDDDCCVIVVVQVGMVDEGCFVFFQVD